MRYYIIAGEASGDLHGAGLVHQIHQQDAEAVIRCWGGEKMAANGATLVKHYKDLAFMGFVEVIKHLPTIFKNIKFCKEDIQKFAPDVVVFIDYPGFNLRIAKWAKQQGYRTAYYISPQAWAWKENRVIDIKRDVDKMMVVLPFEVDFYKKWNYEVEYVGHPLIEQIESIKANGQHQDLLERKIIALLPGSRVQEIKVKLPIMLSIIDHFPDYQFSIAAAPSVPIEIYKDIIGSKSVAIETRGTHQLLLQSRAALVTSGTATLETALFGIPEIVCYKGNWLSYQLAKRLIKVKYISLVNLILDKPAVKELIQNDLNTENIKQELDLLLYDNQRQLTIKRDYERLWQLLGASSASEKAAQIIIKLAQ